MVGVFKEAKSYSSTADSAGAAGDRPVGALRSVLPTDPLLGLNRNFTRRHFSLALGAVARTTRPAGAGQFASSGKQMSSEYYFSSHCAGRARCSTFRLRNDYAKTEIPTLGYLRCRNVRFPPQPRERNPRTPPSRPIRTSCCKTFPRCWPASRRRPTGIPTTVRPPCGVGIPCVARC